MCLRIRQDVSCGNLDTLLEQIMLEDYETSVTGSSIANDVFPVLQDLLDRGTSTGNVEI